jgi:hypothetical protein
MGQVTMIYRNKPNEPGDGKVSAQTLIQGACSHTWQVSAKTGTTAWLEWVIPAYGNVIFLTPGGPFVNGVEIVNGTPHTYIAKFDAFVSGNALQNVIESTIVANLYDVQGGSIISSEQMTLWHTANVC